MRSNKRLTKAVHDLRHKLQLNQTDFANKVGVTAMSVSRWESGQNPPPAECVVKMAKMADSIDGFWFFLGQVGLGKNDFRKRL
jgi:transcriptional regulator with XRE-family HTH domain